MLFLSRKKNAFPFLLLFSFLFVFTACQKDAAIDLVEVSATPEARTYPGVDERLWPYFERFETAGIERGFDVDLVASRITGVIEDLDGEHVAGQCTTFGNFRPGRVTLDAEFWNRSSDIFKEFIVFHELGHCFLDRDHREDTFSNGRCVSIMRSGTLDCRDNYNVATRGSYINELFEPNQSTL